MIGEIKRCWRSPIFLGQSVCSNVESHTQHGATAYIVAWVAWGWIAQMYSFVSLLTFVGVDRRKVFTRWFEHYRCEDNTLLFEVQLVVALATKSDQIWPYFLQYCTSFSCHLPVSMGWLWWQPKISIYLIRETGDRFIERQEFWMGFARSFHLVHKVLWAHTFCSRPSHIFSNNIAEQLCHGTRNL